MKTIDRALPVFVYGTLRPGEKNFAPFLKGHWIRIVPASVTGRLYFIRDEGYPYLTLEKGRVRGELIFLAPASYQATLQRLDELEEYDSKDSSHSVYLRRHITATTADGGKELAWTYIWNLTDVSGEPIPSGDFRDRLQSPP